MHAAQRTFQQESHWLGLHRRAKHHRELLQRAAQPLRGSLLRRGDVRLGVEEQAEIDARRLARLGSSSGALQPRDLVEA